RARFVVLHAVSRRRDFHGHAGRREPHRGRRRDRRHHREDRNDARARPPAFAFGFGGAGCGGRRRINTGVAMHETASFVVKPETSPERQAFYTRLDQIDTAPLWEVLNRLVLPAPQPAIVPAMWKY